MHEMEYDHLEILREQYEELPKNTASSKNEISKIYYAHHLYKYNTQVEQYELDLIKEQFSNANILNPNGGLGYTEEDFKIGKINEKEIMEICLNAIDNSDALVFSDMSGVIGRGVYDEIVHAQKNNKPIYHIFGNKVNHVKRIKYEIINKSRRIYAIPIVRYV